MRSVPAPRVTSADLPSPRLVTVGPEHPVWDGPASFVSDDVRGAFVRVIPPPDCDPVRVDEVEAVLRSLAPAAVRTAPSARSEPLPSYLAAWADQQVLGPLLSHRLVVEEVVAEARNVDRAKLAALCDAIMEPLGL